VTHTAANVHDSKALEEAVDAIWPIRKPGRGRPRKRPKKLHADKGYDFPRCRRALRKRGITPRIARRGIESSEKLGRHRWVVERTLSWLNRFRRLKVRYREEGRHSSGVSRSGMCAHLLALRSAVLLGALRPYPETSSLEKMSWAQARWMNAT
jgi:transposase